MVTRYSCQWARELDLLELLKRTGHQPVRISGKNCWFLSPLREEKTASFHVNTKLNRWYDFGLGKGGNTLDFAQQFFGLDVTDSLQKLKAIFSAAQPLHFSFQQPKNPSGLADEKEKKIEVISVTDLTSRMLLDYGSKRGIPPAFLKQFCKQVSLSLYGKQYEAIGFPNQQGGWELRNVFFKGSSSPKSISFHPSKTFVNVDEHGTVLPTFSQPFNLTHPQALPLKLPGENSPGNLHVFEGFFDFLSYQTLVQNRQSLTPTEMLSTPQQASSHLILNSLSFFQSARPLMEKHASIFLFLDRGKSGMAATQNALGWSKQYVDGSRLYQGFDDLNEWFSRGQQPAQQQRRTRGRHV